MKVKNSFLGKKVIFEGNEVVLSKDIDKALATKMSNSGYSIYLEGKRGTKPKASKPTNINNPKAKAKDKKTTDANTDKGSADSGSGAAGGDSK